MQLNNTKLRKGLNKMENTSYYVRRLKDNRLVAGLFLPLKTKEIANRMLKQWQYNFPNDEFFIEERK